MLAPGMAADIVLFRLDDLGLAGAMHDPIAALALTTGMRRAHWVMVNGCVVVDNGQLLHLDSAELLTQANRLSARMVSRAAVRTNLPFLSHPDGAK
jgi:cytosine/adenosine deaminase-related metal-dependent hydrolase